MIELVGLIHNSGSTVQNPLKPLKLKLRSNPNLSERLLKLHGRWKSDIAKNMYILEQTQNRLSVTCNLGLKVDNVIASLE